MDYNNIKCCKEVIDGLSCRLFLKKEGERPFYNINPEPFDNPFQGK
ncbi:MAG: hypothetical protein K2J82_00510 [Muribaculaceae bacterium]|nr:hypothetical protein [Muribaculaceae bacterium]